MSSGQGKLQAAEPERVQEQLTAALLVSAQAQAQLMAAVLGLARAQGLQLLGASRPGRLQSAPATREHRRTSQHSPGFWSARLERPSRQKGRRMDGAHWCTAATQPMFSRASPGAGAGAGSGGPATSCPFTEIRRRLDRSKPLQQHQLRGLESVQVLLSGSLKIDRTLRAASILQLPSV